MSVDIPATAPVISDAPNKHIQKLPIKGLKKYGSDRIDKYGHKIEAQIKYALQEPVSLVVYQPEGEGEVVIPAGSILEATSNEDLNCELPTGETFYSVKDANNEDKMLSVIEIEVVDGGLDDPLVFEILTRLGVTRELVMAIAAVIGDSPTEVSKSYTDAFDPEKRKRREEYFAQIREINGLFEGLFKNGRGIEGVTQIGEKDFAVFKGAVNNDHVSLTVNLGVPLRFGNRYAYGQDTNSSERFRGLEDWSVTLNDEKTWFDRDRQRYEQAFGDKKPLAVLLEALQNFQVAESSRANMKIVD